MSDCARGSEPSSIAAVPSPPETRSGPAPLQPSNGAVQPVKAPAKPQRPGGCRATVRDALDAALHGIRLGGRDRRFLRGLVHWDKRNAAAVALLLRARQAARSEAALSARSITTSVRRVQSVKQVQLALATQRPVRSTIRSLVRKR
jgi:hypothetical protein